MYSVHVVLWCSESAAATPARTPEEAGLAVEAGTSVALLEFFKSIHVTDAIVEYRHRHAHPGFVVEMLFHSSDGYVPSLPDGQGPAERVLEHRITQVLREVFEIESVVRVRLSHVLPPTPLDEAIEDFA
jgi:hypothetical protein